MAPFHRITAVGTALLVLSGRLAPAQSAGGGAGAGPPCAQHARNCPAPKVLDVGPAPPSPLPPSDAVVLFDGQDLEQWRSPGNAPARWRLGKDYFEVEPGAGSIYSVARFGDVQLHVEWASPMPPDGRDQDRGNSGVYLMGLYEVQVLDSYGNVTYPDGQAAAVYGQYPPLVDASRGPGEWQSYDIIFRRPRFSPEGALLAPARMTVLHNGVLVHDHVVLTGPTGHQRRPPYVAHADKLPISLQDHQHPVRYRNIWARDLEQP